MTPQFDVIGIVVTDMSASVAFYRRLGLDFPAGSEAEPHAEAALPNGFRLALDTEATIKSFHPTWAAPTGAGRIGLAFRCADPAEVDSVYNALVDAGYHGELKPWDAFWGQRYASIQDPDGNGIDLYAALPTAD
ncbi:catechol 2,3-dioxygenase-like lactoylglutathione lyase family enzyme [Nocardia tenerifensis]|uniref:Catechol 2,3-dioxygenase-like lactoylglutathione lyase family enzyme n=1 Tax=Nocardia tenerifensis TaxID=228006 RepID=A0A318K786_9NOCA|nr:VOC family protein [Nocardia tenerifensis]PXX69208.1 catechol 2,3-dioxygenase-like lactoylglutathione lyase family enzyme [Nocardia tenerifensis]